MHENDLNAVISKSLSWSFKIPDDGTSLAIGVKRPFDGFGAHHGFPVYWEAKYLNSVRAFNFSALKEHQIENLIALKQEIPYAKCLFIVGVQWSARELRAYIFEDLGYIKIRKQAKKSILAEEFKTLTNFIVKKNGVFDFDI